MEPGEGEYRRGSAAFHHHGGHPNPESTSGQVPAQFVIVGQMIGDGFESTGRFEGVPLKNHGRSQREIERLEAGGLKDLAPEIGIRGESFPSVAEAVATFDSVKAIHQTHSRCSQEGRCLANEIGRRPDVGVADAEDRVNGVLVQLDQS
jgi:hypothetical protein